MILANYPGHLATAAMLLALTGVVAFAYRTRNLRRAKIWRWIFAAVRVAVILAILVILWNPSNSRYTETTQRNTVMAVFDTSESMSVPDGNGETRLDEALKAFQTRFRPGDPESPLFRIHGFDTRAYEADSPAGLRRWGEQSNLQRVFDLLKDYIPQKEGLLQRAVASLNDADSSQSRMAGAVIFTDGQANLKLPGAYPALSGEEFPILLVGVGSADLRGDVAVRSIQAPARVQIDTTYTADILVAGQGITGGTLEVELLRNGMSVARKTLDAEALEREGAVVTFDLSAVVLGEQVLTARVKTSADEVNRANNVLSTVVNVVEDPTIEVLFYSQVASTDIGKVRQALVRDKKVRLDFGLDAVVKPRLIASNTRLQGSASLPSSPSGYYGYDVVILGPCELDGLSPEQVDGLYSFVADRGGGLVLLPGRAQFAPTHVKSPKLRALLPAIEERRSAQPDTQWRGVPELTLLGSSSRVLSMDDLKALPVVTSPYYSALTPKPASSILAEVKDTPILYVHRVGRGQVALLNVRRLYEWYNADVNGGLLQRLLSGLTTYVGRVPESESAIEVFAARDAEDPNTVTVDALVYDEGFRRVADASVLLTVGAKGETLRMDPTVDGRFSADIHGVRAEALVARVSAERNGRFLGERVVTATLPLPRTEMANVALDAAFLKELATETGGEYRHVSELGEVADAFESMSTVRRVQETHSAWPRWPVFLTLCAVLSTLWFARRTVGLV